MRLHPLTMYAMAFAFAGCGGEDPVTPEGEPIGFYSMNTLAGQALPAPLPCGGGTVTNAMLDLGPDGGASLHRGYDLTGRGAAEFNGQGSYQRVGDAIVVTLEGRFTGEPETRTTIVFAVNGQELREVIGKACDADAVAVYLPALVALD